MIGKILSLYIRVENTTAKDLSAKIGISPNTLSRLISVGSCDAHTLMKLMAWLFTDPHQAPQDKLAQGELRIP